jgi:phenylalanyl-tRNA synthetase alpha chain
MNALDTLMAQALADFAAARDPASLEDAKARYLGKAGSLTAQLKSLGGLAPDARREQGAAINAAKTRLEDALGARRAQLADAKLGAQLAAEALDVSLPGRDAGVGGLHPLTHTLDGLRCRGRSGDRGRFP